MARAFRLLRGDAEAGLLGEGAGPFVSAAASDLPNPHMRLGRFTSSDALLEHDVIEALERARSFDDALRELERRGFVALAVDYQAVFMPAGEVPPFGPDHHDTDVDDL